MKNNAAPAIKPTKRIIPIANPAFAPPDMPPEPLEGIAVGEPVPVWRKSSNPVVGELKESEGESEGDVARVVGDGIRDCGVRVSFIGVGRSVIVVRFGVGLGEGFLGSLVGRFCGVLVGRTGNPTPGAPSVKNPPIGPSKSGGSVTKMMSGRLCLLAISLLWAALCPC